MLAPVKHYVSGSFCGTVLVSLLLISHKAHGGHYMLKFKGENESNNE